MKYKSSRPKGLVASWRPQEKTQALLAQVEEVLETYADHLPLTVRQIFYRLVGKYGYEKSERAYGRLLEVLVTARRAQRIPFEAIRDDGWTQRWPHGFSDPEDFIQAVRDSAERYERDKQARQPHRLAVAVEAAGMVPQVYRVATPFSVPVFSSSGFDSLTVKKQMADLVLAEERPLHVLHLSDYDPSGVCIFDALQADVEAFVGAGERVTFTRIALTSEQVHRFDLPTSPAKENDKRGDFHSQTCQAEALPPDVLADEIRRAIVERVDPDVLREDQAAEKRERLELLEVLGELL